MFGAPSGAMGRGGHHPSEPANVRPTRPWNPAQGAVSSDSSSSGSVPSERCSCGADSPEPALSSHGDGPAPLAGAGPSLQRTDLSNEVQWLGVEGPDGAYERIATCAEWRQDQMVFARQQSLAMREMAWESRIKPLRSWSSLVTPWAGAAMLALALLAVLV